MKNGPAFPVDHKFIHPNSTPEEMQVACGLSVRDYFAGQALAGLLPSVYERHVADHEMQTGGGPAAIARMAYVQADAMLAEREKTP